MSRVWIRCFIMPSKLADENIYRIVKYDGSALEGFVGRPFVVPTHSAGLATKSQVQLDAERAERLAAKKAAREDRRRLRAAGIKPVRVKLPKRVEQTPILCMWGVMLADLYREVEDRAVVGLPDGQTAEIKVSRIIKREIRKDAAEA